MVIRGGTVLDVFVLGAGRGGGWVVRTLFYSQLFYKSKVPLPQPIWSPVDLEGP